MTHVIEFPIHIGDFLSGTIHMSAEETGAYIMLIMAHMQAGEKGLPNNDTQLARIAKVTPRVWKKIKPVLEPKFTINDAFWEQKTCQKVLRRIQEKSNAAKAKALKRHNSGNATAKPQQCKSTCTEDANQKPPNQSKKEKINKKEKKKDSKNPLWWSGEVIRLNKKDYQAWLKLYGGTDDQFTDFLLSKDRWYSDKAPPERRKNWFLATLNQIKGLAHAD